MISFAFVRYLVSTESGNVLIWNVTVKAVVFKCEQRDVQQIILLDEDTKFIAVSKVTMSTNYYNKTVIYLQS